VKQRNGLPFSAFTWPVLIGLLTFLAPLGICQETPSQSVAQASTQDSGNDTAALTAAVRDLQQQVQELRSAVAEVRSEAAQYRQQTDELRHELELARQTAASQNPTTTATPASTEPVSGSQPTSLAQRVESLEETTGLLNDKVNEEAQTRIESASKYHVRLSGLVLVNLFDNHGNTDNADLPSFALLPNPGQSTSNFGATIRQSEIGLEVFGPEVAGAKVSGNLTADFSGGFPNTWNGVNSGLFRLLYGNVRMDWKDTALIVGQDSLFISPFSPTSFASIAIPAFNYAGNLWAWTPQIRIEHKIPLGEEQEIKLQAGILDNLTGDFPANSFDRVPQGGENSGQPAYATRVAWNRNLFGSPMTLAAAGYYSHQDWGFGRKVDGWAGMADWDIPLVEKLSLTGEFYSGRALGGIGGGIGRSVLFSGNPALSTTTAYGLHARGGWSQLKLQATSKLEFNTGFGIDNPDADDAREFSGGSQYIGTVLVRNVGALGNLIYRPRSDVILSTEYRYLTTTNMFGAHYSANQLNMIMGILF
jgi:cell division septum initiation protein DivIVA